MGKAINLPCDSILEDYQGMLIKRSLVFQKNKSCLNQKK